tara:strand:+ start:130 stop:639 length:510 start_codon:yes stop_codon:yes gene_type:complete
MVTNTESDVEVDLVPANDLQAAQIREIALNGVESLQRTAANMQEASAAMGRWILASLLAMNSGGAVAAISASDRVIGPLGPAIVAFAIGAALAVTTGLNGLVTALRAGPVLGSAIELLRLSVYESTIHVSTKNEVRKLVPILRQQLIVSSVLAAGSLGAFFVGIWCSIS